MKEASEEEFLRTGAEVGRLCRACGATFLLDDRVELVHRLGADGVHLGKNDMPPREARALLGPQKIIGATANTFGDIERAAAQGADYIGLGPFRFTRTKEKLSPILGIEGYREILARCAERGIRGFRQACAKVCAAVWCRELGPERQDARPFPVD